MITDDYLTQPSLIPAYAEVFYRPPYVTIAHDAVKEEPNLVIEERRGQKQQRGLRAGAAYWAELAIETALKTAELLKQIKTHAEEKILGPILGQLDLALVPGEPFDSNQGLLAAMCARDLARYWVTPDWRVQLSYRQLVQSRIWARAIADPLFDSVTANLCDVEMAIKEMSFAYIDQELNPRWAQPWLTAGAEQLRAAGSQWNLEVLENVMMAATMTEIMRAIAAPIEDAYNWHPEIQRLLPDRLANRGGSRTRIKDEQAKVAGY